MRPDSRQVAVGGFVLGGFGLLLGAIIFFGKLSLFSQSTSAAVVFQDSIAGLSVGSPVTFRGVRVGSVERIGIEFDPKTKIAYIPVALSLGPSTAFSERDTAEGNLKLPALITRGLRAQLKLQSFVTGQSQIDLDFDPTSPAILHPDITSLPEIPSRQSTLQRATEELSQLPMRDLVDNSLATLKSLRGLSEKLDHDLPPLIESLKAMTVGSAAAVETAKSAIETLQGQIGGTFGAIQQAANAGSQQLNQRGAELHTLLTASNQTMLQVHDLLADLRTMTSERAAARSNIDATLRDLAAAAASLRGFANDVEHNPQLLLTGRHP